ncbi:MAG: B12-binding domain-containing radical SAM protein [Nostoc sp. CreGUA01]|nr:radical SAM protein [Nostoc sp. CreGUA01]
MLPVKSKTVLVSQPPLVEMGLPYLPIMWGIFKTYWENYGTGKDYVRWLSPINQVAEVSTLLRPYQDTSIDVLALSCYIWNWKLQCLIAQQIKALHPQCLIIAGGPEPDYKDVDFFKKYPYIDMVAVKDGEITFTKILKKVLEYDDTGESIANKNLFGDISGLYLPGTDGKGHIYTGPTEVPTEFHHSPYIEQSAYYQEMLSSISSDVIVIWETNRGCPYKCSYCDWGSNTMSKIRQLPMERIKAEIEWFGQMKIGFVMSADANFGMLPRDMEIADLLIAANKKYGFPKYFSYNTAKNNPDRALTIAKKFLNTGLLSAHVLSIQHTNREVLAATNRSNISTQKQYEVARQLMEDGIPVYVQLILGIPGDKYEYWKACFSDLMEWGIHTYYWVFPYNLLPNAPAAEPDYIQKWEIETVDRYVLLNHGMRLRGPFDPLTTKSRLIVKTKTFSSDDWVKMNTYAAYIKSLHNCSVTQLIAIYLRFTHNIPYDWFYNDLFDNFIQQINPARDWYQAVQENYQAYLANDDAIAFMDIPQFPQFEYQIEPSHWIFIQICLQLEYFFDTLKEYLLQRYPDFHNLESVVEYQKQLIVLPSYDKNKGKIFTTNLDWITYFTTARRLVSYTPLAEPQFIPNTVIKVSDVSWTDEGLTLPFNWGNGNEEERWIKWFHTMVFGRNSSYKNNFQILEIQQQNALVAHG